MDYSIDQAKTIIGLLHDVTWYAVPVFLALIFPLLWVMFKKLLGLSNSTQKNDSTLDKIASFISLQGDNADKIVFGLSLTLFVVGVIVLKLGESYEEGIRRKALALKQYYYLNLDRFSIPTTQIPDYFKGDLRAILKRYPQDFIATIDTFEYTVNVKDTVKVKGTVIESIFCVDSNHVNNYKNYVNNYLTEYFDKKLAIQNRVNVNVFSSKNYLQNFFLNRFVYNFLAQPSTAAKYLLETDSNNVYISARHQLESTSNTSQHTAAGQSVYQMAVDNIINELKSHRWTNIGFKRLRENTNQDYTDDFLRQIPDYSAGRLKIIQLKQDGKNDTVGFQMMN
jgi:hypothetical protein